MRAVKNCQEIVCFIVLSALPIIFNLMLVKYHTMYLVVTCHFLGEGVLHTITASCCDSSLPFQESSAPPSSCVVLVGVDASLPQWTPPPACMQGSQEEYKCSCYLALRISQGLSLAKASALPLLSDSPADYQ